VEFQSVHWSCWKNFVCLILITLLPVSLFADDTAIAILHSNSPGGVLVNQSPAADSTALYPNDLIATQKDSVARIESAGSAADLGSETIVQIQSDELILEHGHITVNSTRGFRVRVGCVTISPANSTEWTRYEVLDLDGKVTVTAVKQDVRMEVSANGKGIKHAEASPEMLREGQQATRTEKCDAEEKFSTRLAGIGPILDSPWAIGAGITAIGVLTCWALCRSGQPVSPTGP
jgi:hypothetical protein